MSEYVHANGLGSEPGVELTGDQESPRSGAQGQAPQPWTEPKTQKGRKGKGNPLFSILFLCFSLTVLIFALREYPLRSGPLLGAFADRLHLTTLLPAFRAGPTPFPGEPVSSYLSFSSREALAREAFALMERKKEELVRVERTREELEKEKNSFVGEMDERKELLDKYASILDFARPEEKTAFFETSLRRRVDLYFMLYGRKKEMLQRERERLKGEIRDLAAYMVEVENPRVVPVSPDLGLFFRESAGRRLASRLLFLIERREYGMAIGTLETLLALDRKGTNRLQAALLQEVLKLLRDHQERAAAFKKGALLDDLKMAYLKEDYEKSRELSARLGDSLGADGYMLPMLAEFRGALERNIRLSQEIIDDLSTKKSLKTLGRKALALEQQGEHEKALKIYQELLIFNLPADDRERIMGKIRVLVVADAKLDAKRRENTKASAYLETARLSDREGREKEAFDGYRKIILECPNSDYAGEALARLLALSKAGGM